MEKPPDINPELLQEVENRMRSQASATASSATPSPVPKASPNKHGSLKARRTGLSTVLEAKVTGVSLNPDRISPMLLRRTSDCNSSDASPCDGFQAMQEEAAAARLAQNEGASSADSASSGYMSPHFLRPPSPDELHMQPRRSSDSGVDMPSSECGLRNSSSVPSQPIQQLYDEMYMDPTSPAVTLNNSRRYSYPNSPVHGHQLTSSSSTMSSALSHYHAPVSPHGCTSTQPQLDQRLQQQKIQHSKIEEEESAANVYSPAIVTWKGSITQGVPSAVAASTSPIPPMSSLGVPIGSMAHSCSFDEAYESAKPKEPKAPRCGSATNLVHLNMEDSDVDYVSLPFTPTATSPRPSLVPKGPQQLPTVVYPVETHPEICVTNVTGDEVKFVFGSDIAPPALVSSEALIQEEPMDHS
jgi:hypothetical protein